jgi:hypothetical protein
MLGLILEINLKYFLHAGVAVKGIIQMCEDVGNMQVDKRKGSVEVVATHIRDSLRMQQQLTKGSQSRQ